MEAISNKNTSIRQQEYCLLIKKPEHRLSLSPQGLANAGKYPVLTLGLATARECLFCLKNTTMDHLCEHLFRVQPCAWMVLLLLVNYFSPREEISAGA